MTDKNLVINYTTGDPSTTRININDLINIERLQQKLSENDDYFHNIIAKIQKTEDWKKVQELSNYRELNTKLTLLTTNIEELNNSNQTFLHNIQTNVKSDLNTQYDLAKRLTKIENIENAFATLKDEIEKKNENNTEVIKKYKETLDTNMAELETRVIKPENLEEYRQTIEQLRNDIVKYKRAVTDDTDSKIQTINDFIRTQGTTLLGNPVTKIEILPIDETEAKKKYLKYKMKYLLLKQSLNDKNI